MATDEQDFHQVPPLEMELDEASIMSSLARLQEMHISLRNLRETIPKVMDSVLVDPASPDQLHSNFSQAANGAAQAIKNFTLMVEDSRTKEVMDKAKESRAKTVESITGWKVTEHEDWLNLKQADGNDDVDKDEEGTAEAGDGPSAENVNTMLDKLRSSHAGIEVSLDEDSRTVTLHLPPPAQINFQIQLDTTSGGHNSYSVDSKDNSKLHRVVLEEIRARPRPNHLAYLLEMMASYIDIKSKPYQEKGPSNLMAVLKANGWPCTQHAPELAHWIRCQGGAHSLSAQEDPIFRSRFVPRLDNGVWPAVSPSREVVLRVRISALKIEHTNELFILPKRFATIVPANVIAVRMLVPPRFPVTPDRSLRLTSVLFCDEDVGTFVGEDVFPSTPDTSMLIVWPYELPSIVLSPGAVWPFRGSTGTPCSLQKLIKALIMAHAQNPWGTPSNTMTSDAEAYRQAQYYGRALIKVRIEQAEMRIREGRLMRALIEEPFTGSFKWRVWEQENSLEADDEEFTQKLLWWHARVVTGHFLPPEITKMILGAMYPESDSDFGFSL
ncbi:MAG: hypothetical protein ASARMPRED_009183 [Alectoria sarmentosa]|nr:MAG: hypothetical protein ASARMPRED_009183 [Alectoria sarmentosa]